MLSQPLQDTCNTFIAGFAMAFRAKQIAYKAANGQFCQFLISHTSIPADGATSQPDNLGAHPTDQVDTWAEFNDLYGDPITIDPMPCAIRCDIYETGYIARASVVENGVTYMRSIVYDEAHEQGQAGPLDGIAHDWRSIE